jgi:hypothetical protein
MFGECCPLVKEIVILRTAHLKNTGEDFFQLRNIEEKVFSLLCKRSGKKAGKSINPLQTE